MDEVAEVVERWLREDKERPRKQRHTARRIWMRLVAEHDFKGSEGAVRRWVCRCKRRLGLSSAAAVVPLDPEVAREAEVDWGSAWVVMAGQRRQVKFFCMRSRYSGKPFVRAYPWERQEMFLDAHMHAFAYYEGVFPILVYDNLTVAVRQIMRGKGRVEQERFAAFRSYYTFQARFCNPAAAHEKGGVEGLVGFARRNFFVPLPEVADFEQLNVLLLERCSQRDEAVIGGREDNRTIGQRHEQERLALLPLPPRPFDNQKQIRVRIDAYQTAHVDRNRYSVPTAYVGRWLWAHVGCHQVALYADQAQVARHRRIFGNSKWQIDPLHYLELIGERIGSFDSARPIRQWRSRWPESYERMLEQLRRRRGDNAGSREFVRILQLHGSYSDPQVQQAVAEALQWQTYSYQAVKHLLLRQQAACQYFPLPADLIPGITDRVVVPTDVACYDSLLAGGGQ